MNWWGSKAEGWWESRIRLLTCALHWRRGFPDVPMEEIHHLLDTDHRRVGPFASIPVCRACHQGPEGIHRTSPPFEVRYKFTQLDLLNDTIGRVVQLILNHVGGRP